MCLLIGALAAVTAAHAAAAAFAATAEGAATAALTVMAQAAVALNQRGRSEEASYSQEYCCHAFVKRAGTRATYH